MPVGGWCRVQTLAKVALTCGRFWGTTWHTGVCVRGEKLDCGENQGIERLRVLRENKSAERKKARCREKQQHYILPREMFVERK